MCPDEPHLVTYNASGTMVERFYRCLGHSNMIHYLPFHQKVWSTRFVIVLEHLYTFCACARGNNELGNDRQTTLFFFCRTISFLQSSEYLGYNDDLSATSSHMHLIVRFFRTRLLQLSSLWLHIIPFLHDTNAVL